MKVQKNGVNWEILSTGICGGLQIPKMGNVMQALRYVGKDIFVYEKLYLVVVISSKFKQRVKDRMTLIEDQIIPIFVRPY